MVDRATFLKTKSIHREMKSTTKLMSPKERTCEGYQLLSPDRHYAKCGYKRRRLTDLKVTIHMPSSSNRSVTTALQAVDTGSSPVGGTTLVERVKCDNPSIRWTHLYEIPIHTNERNNRCYSRQGQRD